MSVINSLACCLIVLIPTQVHVAKTPNLRRLGLEGNFISSAIKNKYKPLPAMISV